MYNIFLQITKLFNFSKETKIPMYSSKTCVCIWQVFSAVYRCRDTYIHTHKYDMCGITDELEYHLQDHHPAPATGPSLLWSSLGQPQGSPRLCLSRIRITRVLGTKFRLCSSDWPIAQPRSTEFVVTYAKKPKQHKIKLNNQKT